MGGSQRLICDVEVIAIAGAASKAGGALTTASVVLGHGGEKSARPAYSAEDDQRIPNETVGL